MRIIDHRCFCDKCEERTKEIYYLSAGCYNCGKKWIAKFRKGDKPGIIDECPYCEVRHIYYGTSNEAEGMLKNDT